MIGLHLAANIDGVFIGGCCGRVVIVTSVSVNAPGPSWVYPLQLDDLPSTGTKESEPPEDIVGSMPTLLEN